MTDRLRFLDALHADSGSAERARDSEVAVAPVEPTGPFIVAFEDSDSVHEVTLRRDGEAWHGDCWALHEDGDRHGRCKGLTYSDGPCAHLFAVRSAVADDDRPGVHVRDAAQERADSVVERVRADGGRRWSR
ncbi:hypothetical protein [Halorarius halobius]|uniref:hypothetical protein n=1 Tax=Halorarius halobius TaxID=2962671 RepID=UPI0020CC1053|nr:hypothetical protein [Halorarius halobius]